MPDFAHVPTPVFTPTQCLTCTTHKHADGFVDLAVDQPILGHAYMCADCVYTAGRTLGMLSPAQADNLRAELKHAEGIAAALKADLEHERENKLVSLADVKELVRQRGGRPGRQELRGETPPQLQNAS